MPFNKISQALDRRMIKGLTERANKIANDAKENASWSSRIPNAISVGKAEKSGNGYTISIKIDSSRDGPAPHAAAFEYGSGEHGESGKTYTIPGMPWLAIPRERWPKYTPPPDVDPVFLRSVEHPGVKAKPYLEPAIESNRDILRETLSKIIKSAYLDTTVKVTVISAKK